MVWIKEASVFVDAFVILEKYFPIVFEVIINICKLSGITKTQTCFAKYQSEKKPHSDAL